ncbi:phage tail protein [Pseudomonas sp. NFXW11]|uniref:phage tail-collar fiber domain-containing protein n=1 Tax=Pseudomonas sp. NFXW11 TaxID=2819531 RepID=UPI003CF87296
MSDYYTLLTQAGIAYETACKAAGTPIRLSKISVGDGNGAVYNPDATATALRREVWRGDLNALYQDPKNPSWLMAEATIPDDVGGWYVREAGIWTDTGILYAVIKYAESYKPVLATSGQGKEFYLRAIFQTSNAPSVTLLIDDNVVKATRAWVASHVVEELAKRDSKQSVRAATTAAVLTQNAQAIDGVALVAGDRVLVKDQVDAKNNGIYIVTNGVWTRALDADTSAEVTPGLHVLVEEGARNGDSMWQLVTDGPITLGVTSLVFEMLAGRTGINIGTYFGVTVDKYGRVVAGKNPNTLAGFGIVDSYTKAEVDSIVARASALPVGAVLAFPKGTVPPGFLELDGSVQRSELLPDLYAYLGSTFNLGGEPSGFFRLPDSRGEFLRGWDHERGIDSGRVIGSWQKGSLQSFDPSTGSPCVSGLWHTGADVEVHSSHGLDRSFAANYPVSYSVFAGGVSAVQESALGVTRPRNLAVMWCIKAWNAPINQGNIDIAVLASQATEANRGTARIATQPQVNLGQDDETVVTPKKLRFGFSFSFASSGYLAFPSWLGGLIVQWGYVPKPSAAAIPVTWPLVFPNGFGRCIASFGGAGSPAGGVSTGGPTKEGATFNSATGGAGYDISYFVIGW